MGSANGDLLDFSGRVVLMTAAATGIAGTRRASGVQGLASRAGSNRGLATNIICSYGDLRPEAVC